MSNKFIEYLNTLHNARASNDNALAEAQVCNEFYEAIRVNRNIGKYLVNRLTKENPSVIILTGHAGDGKTSLIVQILRSLNLLPFGNLLKKSEYVDLPNSDRKLLYIKDMSELKQHEQDKLMIEALEASKNNTSAILVSNTGPLINTLNRLFANDEKIESKVLEKMDTNDQSEVKVGDYSFQIINIARIDNVEFTKEIIEKILNQDLWGGCDGCANLSKCPIYNNYQSLTENKARVISFTKDFYRWLYENDNRITIRQMLAHIAYSITGGLSCAIVEKKVGKKNLFNHHFANLFFGFKGIEEDPEANQIKGIREIKKLGIDKKSLTHDYQLFVKNDFNHFPKIIKELIEPNWEKFIFADNVDLSTSKKAINMRRSFRRFFLIFSRLTTEEYNNLINQVYSPVYSFYLKAQLNQLSRSEQRTIHSIVTKGLYKIFVGFPQSANNNSIFLTLRRDGQGIPSVQLLQGKISNNDIKIEYNSIKNDFENENLHEIYFTTKEMKASIKISLPLLDYFKRIVDGGISTKINPSLSHGIDKIKANLIENYKKEINEDLLILINTTEGAEVFELYLENDELFIEQR